MTLLDFLQKFGATAMASIDPMDLLQTIKAAGLKADPASIRATATRCRNLADKLDGLAMALEMMDAQTPTDGAP